MNLILYKNFSKKKNSTKQPAANTGTTYNVVLKQGTSLINPTFLIDGIDLDYTYAQFNNRFYFIDDITIGNNKIYEISCSIDYLATYKTEIGNYTAYVERAVSSYDALISDPAISSAQSIAHTNTATTSVLPLGGVEAGCYIIRIAGAGNQGISTYALQSLSQIAGIFDKSNYQGSFAEEVGLALVNPMDYVLSLKWCPIHIDEVAQKGYRVTQIPLKWFAINVTGFVYCLDAEALIDVATTVNKPANYFGDFRDYHPSFTKAMLYIPGIGPTPIASDLLSTTLHMNATVNLHTGDCLYSLRSTAASGSTEVVASYVCNLYSDVQLASTDISAGAVLSDVVGMASGITSTLMGNAFGASTAVGASMSAFNHIMMPTPSIVGANSSSLSAWVFTSVILSVAHYASGDIPIDVYGRPFCKNTKINTLAGFIKCGATSIELNCLDSERDQINTYLNGGFYYE